MELVPSYGRPMPRVVGLCLGSYGGPRGVGVFLWARYPCTPRTRHPVAFVLTFVDKKNRSIQWHQDGDQGIPTLTPTSIRNNAFLQLIFFGTRHF